MHEAVVEQIIFYVNETWLLMQEMTCGLNWNKMFEIDIYR